MAITANKGEWSELYVLFKLLGEKKIHAGDGQLNKLKEYYPVLNVIRDELERHLEYAIEKDIVVVTEDEIEVARINVVEFLKQSKNMFAEIQKGTSAFSIPSLDEFLKKIHCKKVKAKSKDKADIHIVIHDYHTGMQPNLGFSIKSDAGSKPTLLNASAPTTFVYEIEDESFNDQKMNEINLISSKRKIQDRVNAIVDTGASLNYSGIVSSVFENNLRMIDSFLPEIVGYMLADSYLHRDMNIQNAIERIRISNPLNYNIKCGHDYYGYKMKSLMACTALGMLPATPWTGKYEATGGYIVVKNDGDVICFHLYDRNLLEDYLFYNTKFETPTGDRYNLGEIYKNNGKYYFNLVLQIRFN